MLNSSESYLVIGGDGLIGSSLVSHLKNIGKKVVSTTRRLSQNSVDTLYLDLSQDTLPRFDSYSCVFICAGITSLAICESDPVMTKRINVNAIFELAIQLQSSGSKIIYISSNTVFDGSIRMPNENETPRYTTEYGCQKTEIENRLLSLVGEIAIVRITKVVSFKLPIFKVILDNLRTGKSCELYDDLFFCPISLPYLCNCLQKIATTGLKGIFHLSGEEDISYAQFAFKMGSHLKAEHSLVKPIAGKWLLFKPQYAGLGMHRTKQLLNIHPEPISSFLINLSKEMDQK